MPETCPTCAGHGKVRATQGFFTIERSCTACRGTGKIIRHPCKTCRGAGMVQKERTLNVDVPPGVEEGTRIRLSGEGAAGANGGPNGDLYIFLSVAEHPIFQRDGHNLHCRAPVSFVTAALGGSIEVPTLDGGRAKVTIPEGTQPGRQFRLKAKGMPVLRSAQRGDLYIEVAVETPVKLSKRQKELLREFESASQAGTHPEAEGFLARLKEFWNGGETAPKVRPPCAAKARDRNDPSCRQSALPARPDRAAQECRRGGAVQPGAGPRHRPPDRSRPPRPGAGTGPRHRRDHPGAAGTGHRARAADRHGI